LSFEMGKEPGHPNKGSDVTTPRTFPKAPHIALAKKDGGVADPICRLRPR
jgi:hypothetical protein